MSGNRSRRKGAQFERELVKLFREAMPGATVHRGAQFRGGAEAADVVCPRFWVEAKRGKKPNVRAALRQAASDATEGRIPIAVIRDDREQAFAVLSLAHLLNLICEWWERGRQLARFEDEQAERERRGAADYLCEHEEDWEAVAKRLYEHLHPSELWVCLPADIREEWIRGLGGR
jgi:hypothetical protein